MQANISQLRDDVAGNKYRPLPCKQVFVHKGNGEQREIRIPTVRDRIVQHALLKVLHFIIALGEAATSLRYLCLAELLFVEFSFSEASFAYRPNLSYINAVKAIVRRRDSGYRWVLDADITKFFENITLK